MRVKNKEIINSLEKIQKSISSQGNPRNVDTFNVYEDYYQRYNEPPSYLEAYDNDSNGGTILDYDDLKENIVKIFPDNKIRYQFNTYSFKDTIKVDEECIELTEGYVLAISMLTGKALYSTEELRKLNINKDRLFVNSNYMLIPSNSDKDIMEKITELFKKSKINSDIKRTSIEMVSVSNGSFYAEDFYLKDDFVKWEKPELHYGEGFNEFHKELMNRIETNSKGLILFHGTPGSGKTQYIRKIIQELTGKARVLYFSPAMIDSITNPEFIDFIQDWAKELEDVKKKRIIILEDAEPLLESRDNGRNVGITNLLNLTSGLLSDVLSIQYICTFNTKVEAIDQALLREERLTAIKKFDELSWEESIELGKFLDIKEEDLTKLLADKKKKDKDKKGLNLAEIYSINENNEVLEHNTKVVEKKRIGFN
jgi:SpoVK/Ycf46/Vps4 family AAA+-type ATPase